MIVLVSSDKTQNLNKPLESFVGIFQESYMNVALLT